MRLEDENDALKKENRLLIKALREQQQLVDLERRRAEMARESSRAAWAVSVVFPARLKNGQL
jgi:hypothetical protein